MPLIRSIRALHPLMVPRVEQFLRLLKAHDLGYIIVETYRSKLVQEAYYAQGREPLSRVNELRKLAGLWEISAAENAKKITWTMRSKHLQGYAIDLAPMRDGRILWQAPFELWERYGTYGELAGLSWGGRWEERDLPHYELSDEDIKAGWSDAGAWRPTDAD